MYQFQYIAFSIVFRGDSRIGSSLLISARLIVLSCPVGADRVTWTSSGCSLSWRLETGRGEGDATSEFGSR